MGGIGPIGGIGAMRYNGIEIIFNTNKCILKDKYFEDNYIYETLFATRAAILFN